ncbi:18029_t:CDS:2, partial [Racocetra fulgida]
KFNQDEFLYLAEFTILKNNNSADNIMNEGSFVLLQFSSNEIICEVKSICDNNSNDKENSNEESSNEESSNKESSNKESSNEKSSNEESSNKESSNEESNDEE